MWKSFLLLQLFFIAIILLLFKSSLGQYKDKKKPNIIFIYTDDQRFDALGANSNNVIITPELDKMAQQGIRFTNANVVFSLCSPSRAALLTGRYGSANGVLQLGSDLNPKEITIANYLQEAGYQTGISGKWHIGRHPADAGFDFSVYFEGNGTYYGRTIYDEGEKINPEMHCDLYCAKRSVDFLKEAAKGDKPFFLWHNPQTPHMNGNLIWDARVETTKNYNVTEMPVAKNRLDDLSGKPEYLKQVRNLTQAKVYGYPDSLAIQQHTMEYYSVITEMDQFLGLLLRELENLGLRENTYIFFMSDNGWMLGEHGFTSKVLPYRPSSRVPFFLVGPGLKPSVNSQIVLNIDMAPTILELAGIKIPSEIHGESIIPLLKNKNKKWRSSFVYEGLGTYGAAKPNLTVISEDYRYIET
ncbi:sulfatase-like hydrolase/transferase [Mariniphaga sp.]|uniref:sulfatase-like hydrolase/transferase n=1 Tax=Mariniphaga sp. TaxID=1954475 RepID=UPI003567185E